MSLKTEETEASATTTKAASELTVEIQEGTQYPDTEHIIAELNTTYDAANKVSADRHNQKLDKFGDKIREMASKLFLCGPIHLISQLHIEASFSFFQVI